MQSHATISNGSALRRPRLPQGTRVYAIGDIHGRADLLDRCFALIDADLAERGPINAMHVFLGDYIDRGAAVSETIEKLIQRQTTHQCVFLKGNHELIALKCLIDKSSIPTWLRLGGAQTLMSYGIRPALRPSAAQLTTIQMAFQNALPRSHLRFFGALQTMFTLGDYFFVHAGINPHVPLARQNEKDMLWIRDEFLASTKDHGKIIVHGHTPTLEVEFLPNRINIDTGAYLTNRLTCLVLEDDKLSVLQTGN